LIIDPDHHCPCHEVWLPSREEMARDRPIAEATHPNWTGAVESLATAEGIKDSAGDSDLLGPRAASAEVAFPKVDPPLGVGRNEVGALAHYGDDGVESSLNGLG
jgi:hypothetical protein